MCCTSFTPVYNSEESPREEGGVTVEVEDWSSGALSSTSNFPVGNEMFFTYVSASKTVLHYFSALCKNVEKAASLFEGHFKSRNAC